MDRCEVVWESEGDGNLLRVLRREKDGGISLLGHSGPQYTRIDLTPEDVLSLAMVLTCEVEEGLSKEVNDAEG
jgi:hypothetical protein